MGLLAFSSFYSLYFALLWRSLSCPPFVSTSEISTKIKLLFLLMDSVRADRVILKILEGNNLNNYVLLQKNNRSFSMIRI